MNWKQLYTSATPEERLKIFMLMLKTIDERQRKVVFTGNHWVRNRRRGYRAHFLNDRRGRHVIARTVSLLSFAAVLVGVSAATWQVVVNSPTHVGGLMLFFHATSVWAVLAFRPYKNRLKTQTALSS
jgi:hypothetical protein